MLVYMFFLFLFFFITILLTFEVRISLDNERINKLTLSYFLFSFSISDKRIMAYIKEKLAKRKNDFSLSEVVKGNKLLKSILKGSILDFHVHAYQEYDQNWFSSFYIIMSYLRTLSYQAFLKVTDFDYALTSGMNVSKSRYSCIIRISLGILLIAILKNLKSLKGSARYGTSN